MKHLLSLLLLCSLSGCKSKGIDQTNSNHRKLTGEEKTLIGSYNSTTGKQKIKLILKANGYCDLLQEGKKMDDEPMIWSIHKSEIKIQTQWFSKWKDLMHFRVQDNGDLRLVAESMRSNNRIDLPKTRQTIFSRSN